MWTWRRLGRALPAEATLQPLRGARAPYNRDMFVFVCRFFVS